MTILTSAAVLSNFLASEAEHDRSRDSVTLLAGSGAERVVDVGYIIGLRTKSSAVATADGGNTGDGTAGTVTGGALAVAGTYTLTCTVASANAGTCSWGIGIGRKPPDSSSRRLPPLTGQIQTSTLLSFARRYLTIVPLCGP